jgi:excisionase family DNA binding protein
MAPAVPANLWQLHADELPPILLRVEQVARVLTVSRWKVFELIRLGELRSVKVGGSRRVSAMALREFVLRLESEGGAL